MTYLLHTHTQCFFGRDLYTDVPHCDLQMVGFVCTKYFSFVLNNLEISLEKIDFNAGSAFPSFYLSIVMATHFNLYYNWSFIFLLNSNMNGSLLRWPHQCVLYSPLPFKPPFNQIQFIIKNDNSNRQYNCVVSLDVSV